MTIKGANRLGGVVFEHPMIRLSFSQNPVTLRMENDNCRRMKGRGYAIGDLFSLGVKTVLKLCTPLNVFLSARAGGIL